MAWRGLERALGSFMLDLHTDHFGYTEVNPPLMVRDKAAYGTGHNFRNSKKIYFPSYFKTLWLKVDSRWLTSDFMRD